MLKKTTIRGLYLASAAALAVSFGMATPARGNIVITPTFDSTITSDANKATIEASINAAISRAEAVVTTNTTCTITFQEVGTGLGQSSTGFFTEPYTTYINALKTQQTLSTNDNTAITSLNYVQGVTTTNPVNGNANINVGTTLARALNITNFAGSDGTIGFNTSICNLSRTGTQNPGFYDLQAVAGHEIDEVLGIGGPGSALPTTNGSIGTLDLYRWSAAAVRSFTTSTAATPYFSINSGLTDLVHFNEAGGGSDYSDWGDGVSPADGKGNSPGQLQDAFGSPGVDTNLGIAEATALDVIGYNVNYAAAPEPASCTLFILGAVGFLARRRRSSARI